MNPFNLHRKYDCGLSEILSRINKPSTATKEILKELVGYLPNVDVDSDGQAILKAIRPLLGTSLKLLINKILYLLLKQSKRLQPIQVPWIYYNVDSQDLYSRKIFEKYFDVKAVCKEFEEFLKWEDFLRDLSCFLYLVQRSETEHYFSVEKLRLQTYFEFDTLFEILEVIRGKDPIRFLKISHQENHHDKEGGYARIAREAFVRILNVRDPQFLNGKHRILLDIYNFVDDAVYEESVHLDCAILQKIVGKVDCNRLRASTVSQLATILPGVGNPTEFITANVHESICIFDLIRQTSVEKPVLLENREVFTPIANESLWRHCVTKTCTAGEGSSATGVCDIDLQILRSISDLFTGKYKIISSSILNLRLATEEFVCKDIEETMEYAVDVFPKQFFLSREFDASAIPFLKKYPEELNKSVQVLESLVSNFFQTKRADVVGLIRDISMLRQFLNTFSPDEIKQLYQGSAVDDKMRIVYLYYLRSEIEPFEVNYAQVFDHFFSKEFLRFLLSSGYSISSFIRTTVDYIRNSSLENSILHTGFNFDEDIRFYHNLQHPVRDPVLKALLDILETLVLDANLEILLNLIRIILYKPIRMSKSLLADFDSQPTGPRSDIRSIFDLGKNAFIVERYIREFSGDERARLDANVLRTNRNKAMDVILRHFRLSDRFVHNLNPSFLSNISLANVVDSVVAKFSCLDACAPYFTAISSVGIFSEQSDLGSAVSSLTLDGDHEGASVSKDCAKDVSAKDGHERQLENEEVGALIEELFTKRESKSPLDFIYLLENDLILSDKEFRSERVGVYMPLVNLIAEELSSTLINLYSFSKLESGSTDEAVLDFILDSIKGCRSSFWMLLAGALHRTRNVYISMFIEKMVMQNIEGSGCDYFGRNSIVDISEYLKLCSDSELNIFAFVFPLVYSRLGPNRIANLEKLVRDLADTKIDNGRLSFSKTNELYKLRFVYRADSVSHEACIHIPLAFPMKKARIEFNHSMSKNTKFYHKLNELLSKTSKFVEVLLLWKVDIDNHLAGYTECLICYFIMEPRYRALPNFRCSNCTNCYHEKCIYKWVAESRNKQCPLCRVELPLWPKN